jgi:hypothetical protein
LRSLRGPSKASPYPELLKKDKTINIAQIIKRKDSNMSDNTSKRPGLVTFAAIMMFTMGGLYIVWAIEEFANAAWLNNVDFGLFSRVMFFWAIGDLVIAAAAIFAGYDTWRGGNVGRWLGIIFAVLGTIRAFFFIPWIPVGALIVIIIALFIIYGLSTHAEYFEQ